MTSTTENFQNKVENYFKTLNPLAEKISNDINNISDTYAQLWNTFSSDEQHDVINVTLIKPDIVLKYFNDLTMDRHSKKCHSSAMLSKDDATIITDTDSNNDRLSLSSSNSNSYRSNDFSHIYLYNGKDLYTYGQIITALRYNQDDLCGIYRDEHSEPFNTKTKSQMNLNFGQTADAAHAKIERAQKKYAEIKLPAVSGFDEIKKGRVDHVPELCAKLASMNSSNTVEHNGQDGNVVRKSFMSKLFNNKNNTVPVKMPKPKVKDEDQVDSLSGINLVIDSNVSKDFDSMSTKSAGSCDKPDDISDMSRLIDTNDDDNELNVGSILSKPINYDFLNNW